MKKQELINKIMESRIAKTTILVSELQKQIKENQETIAMYNDLLNANIEQVLKINANDYSDMFFRDIASIDEVAYDTIQKCYDTINDLRHEMQSALRSITCDYGRHDLECEDIEDLEYILEVEA